MSKIKNVNQNINTIIFPEGMEIRKVKKKKKKKKAPSKKKEAIEELKSVLQQFDAIVNEAKSKNITIPKELGVLPQNINEIDSLSEIVALTNTLRQRITAIRELINKGAQPSLFGDVQLPQRAGVFPVSEPIVRPEIIQPVQPQPVQPQPIQPQPTPQPTPEQPADDTTEKTLEQLRNEILQKLTPEQRAEAEKKLEEEKQKQAPEEPSIPDEPSVPQPSEPLPDVQADLETNLNIQFGTQTIPRLVSPVGFYDIFTNYRRYVKDLIFRTKKIIEGQYRISKADETILKNEKNRILNSYESWSQSLNKPQAQYLDNNAGLLSINNEMLRDLNLDVGKLAQNILIGQGVKLTNFAVGDTPVPIEQKAEERLSPQGQNFKVQLDENRNIIESNLEKSKKSVNPDELNEIINDLNLVKVNIDNYNKLQPNDKAGLDVLYGQVVDEYNTAQKEVQDKLLEVKKGLPPQETEGTPQELSKEEEEALIVLIDYVSNTSSSKWSANVKSNLAKLPNGLQTVEAGNAKRGQPNAGTERKKIVREYLDELSKKGGGFTKYLQGKGFGQTSLKLPALEQF